MFKAVKMKRLKFLLLSFVLGCAMLAGAQTPEVFPLWPQGVKENNGIKVDRTVDDQGGISNNSTAELLVFHPDPAKNTGKAVLICPGGGYTYLAMGYEGEEFAQWLVKQGITGIVLKYRMPNQHDRIPMTDALRAMKWIRSRSEEWGIDPAKVGIAGFSAGGHLASTLATHFDQGKTKATDSLERFSCRPDFTILFYPVISMQESLTHKGSQKALLGKTPAPEKITDYSNELQITAETPKTFLVHSDDDKGVSVQNSIVYYQALKKHNIPAVMYIFPTGGHGWGLRSDFEYYPAWTSLLKKWLEDIGK